MNNQLPTWFSYLMLGTHQLGLGKGKLRVDGNQDFRFIGIGESSRRLWWRAAFSTQGDCLREFSEPYQLSLGTKGGGQTLALGTAALMELYPDHVFIQDDLTNMFGAARRKEGVTNILKAQGCRLFHRAIESESYPESLIYVKGATGKLEKAPWVYSEGGAQGATSCSSLHARLFNLH